MTRGRREVNPGCGGDGKQRPADEGDRGEEEDAGLTAPWIARSQPAVQRVQPRHEASQPTDRDRGLRWLSRAGKPGEHGFRVVCVLSRPSPLAGLLHHTPSVAFRKLAEELIALLPRLEPAGAGSSVSFAPPPLTPPPAKVSLRS